MERAKLSPVVMFGGITSYGLIERRILEMEAFLPSQHAFAPLWLPRSFERFVQRYVLELDLLAIVECFRRLIVKRIAHQHPAHRELDAILLKLRSARCGPRSRLRQGVFAGEARGRSRLHRGRVSGDLS